MGDNSAHSSQRAQGPSDEEITALQRQILHPLDLSGPSMDQANDSISLADQGSALDRAVNLARARVAEPLLSGPSSGLVNTASPDSFASASGSAVPRLAEQLVSSASTSAPSASAPRPKGKARARSRSPSPAPASSAARPSTPPSFLDPDELVKTFPSLSPLTMGRMWSQIKRGSKRRREPSTEGHQQAPAAASAPKVARQALQVPQESLPRQPSRLVPRPPPDIPEVPTNDTQGNDNALPFVPGLASASTTMTPAPNVMQRLSNSQLVPLWHFTDEGMNAGCQRLLSMKEYGSSFTGLLESLSKSTEPGSAKKDDALLTLSEFVSATCVLVEAMRTIAHDATDPISRRLLDIECDIRTTQFDLILTHPLRRESEANWPVLAEYCQTMRRKYYALPVGSRLDISFIHNAVLDPIASRFTTRLAVQEILSSLKSSAASANSSAAASSSSASKGKTSGTKQPAAAASPANPKPFRQGVESRSPRLGDCIVCGVKEYNHAFESCSKRADGKPAFAARDERSSTSQSDATSPPPPPAIEGTTSAPSAAPVHTMHKLAGASPSPLSADGYEKMLKDLDLFHAYGEVVEGLRSGFDFGIPPVSAFRSPQNHGSATNDFDTLNASIKKEVSLGRSLGPFTQEQVEDLLGPFQTSPLGLVPKPNGKWRMVQDFSYPKKGAYASVNSYI